MVVGEANCAAAAETAEAAAATGAASTKNVAMGKSVGLEGRREVRKEGRKEGRCFRQPSHSALTPLGEPLLPNWKKKSRRRIELRCYNPIERN